MHCVLITDSMSLLSIVIVLGVSGPCVTSWSSSVYDWSCVDKLLNKFKFSPFMCGIFHFQAFALHFIFNSFSCHDGIVWLSLYSLLYGSVHLHIFRKNTRISDQYTWRRSRIKHASRCMCKIPWSSKRNINQNWPCYQMIVDPGICIWLCSFGGVDRSELLHLCFGHCFSQLFSPNVCSIFMCWLKKRKECIKLE